MKKEVMLIGIFVFISIGVVGVYAACDDDVDGYYEIACGGSDCWDYVETVHPGAEEVCDGRDNDCDGLIDEDDPDFIDCGVDAVCRQACIQQYDFSTLGEYGKIENVHNNFGLTDESVQDEFLKVNLKNSYSSPVIIAKPLSYFGHDPSHIRLRRVGGNNFEMRVEEWEWIAERFNYEWDRLHAFPERVDYIAMDVGEYDFDNKKIKVGKVNAQGYDPIRNINFPEAFSSVPIVLAQIQTYNEEDAVAVRVSDVTTTGFTVRMQEQENKNDGHAQETIGWIAFETGSGGQGELGYKFGTQADITGDASGWRTSRRGALTDWTIIDFGQQYESPAFLVDMQTFNGQDTCGLRYKNLVGNNVEVSIEEEGSGDSEFKHLAETVGYVVLSKITIPEPPPELIELTDAYWTNEQDVRINIADIGQNVKLVVKGSPNGTQINFEVYDENILGDSDIRTGSDALNAVISGGEASVEMIITQADYDAGSGDRKFYFIASVVSNTSINIQSNILEVYPSICSCNDGTLCGECSLNKPRYCTDIGELIDDCDRCGCPDELPSCILETGECILIDQIIYCGDYNQTDCENDPQGVAEDTWETELGYGEGSCGEQDVPGCTYYNVDCMCKWQGGECIGASQQDYNCDTGSDTGECIPKERTLYTGCDEEPLNWRNITITYDWTGSGERPAFCPASKSILQKCISRVMLGFFDSLNLIIAIMALIVFYLVVIRNRKKLKKETARKTK